MKAKNLIRLGTITACLFLAIILLLRLIYKQPLVEAEIPKFSTKKEIADHKLRYQLLKVLKGKSFSSDYRVSNRILNVKYAKQNLTLNYFGSSVLSVSNQRLYLVPEELTANLNAIFLELEKNMYGEALPWSEAKLLFPKNKEAIVTDLETGLSFKVRRKAGSYHADVQPITAKDTEVMKRIYNGSWSWKRRAIILSVDGKRIAASMNGMPHGAGSIKNNNFPGHFCIHFLGSKVHKSNKIDLAHQLMIAKASGRLEQEIYNSTPEQIVLIFLTALKQQDWNMASLTLGFKDEKDLKEVLKILQACEDLKSFTIYKEKTKKSQKLVDSIPVSLNWKKKGDENYKTTKLLLTLKKLHREGEWYISADSLYELK